MTISFIVPTIGRASLKQTLESIELRQRDEIVVVGVVDHVEHFSHVKLVPCARGYDWGCAERTLGIAQASGDYLAFLDDDDVYVDDHRFIMREAMDAYPERPVLFRMQYPNGKILWDDPELRMGNVGSPMILVPNDTSKLGTWTSRREGDFDFLRTSKWRTRDFAWHPAVIARLGHDD